jgi:hypothetical protein
MGYIAMAIPAIAIKRLGSHHNGFNGGLVTSQTVRLDDTFGSLTGSDRHGDVSGCKGIHVFCTLATFFQIIGDYIFVGQVTIHTLGEFFMRCVVPVFVL